MASGPPTGAGSAQGSSTPKGPPYASQVQGFGGVPDVIPDVPICAVFLFLYLMGAITHMTIFQKNKRQGSLFVMSAMTFGFCMCRLITFTLRLTWATQPRNVSLALASNIFVAAGTPILYIINLIFTHRIIRAQHPRLGWHKMLSILSRLTLASILLVLAALIAVGLLQAYSLSSNSHRIGHNVQLFGSTFNTFIAFLPAPMILIGLILPRRIRVEKFGQGRFRTKIAVILAVTTLLTIRAAWGTTTSWLPPVPRASPTPFYYSKSAFYTVQLLTELLVVYLFAFVRVDRRFYTPTGIRNTYLPVAGEADIPYYQSSYYPYYPSTIDSRPSTGISTTIRIFSEEELFDDCGTLADTLRYSHSSITLDKKSGNWELRGRSVSSMSSVYMPEWYGFSDTGSTVYSSVNRPGVYSAWSENY